MARAPNADNRIELRLPAEQKAMIARAASLSRLDLTGFILRAVLPEAQAVVQKAERLALSERDSLKVLELLENPLSPPDRLVRAAAARRARR